MSESAVELADANREELRRMLTNAAEHLRTAAAGLDTFTARIEFAPALPQTMLEVLEAVGRERWLADASLAHASHRFAMAILWQERSKGLSVE